MEIKDKPRKETASFLSVEVTHSTLLLEQHGVCRAISYIIQTLSAETAFGQQLSKPVRVQIPTKWGPVDTVADFLIHVRRPSSKIRFSFSDLCFWIKAVYTIVATTAGNLTSLYPALIIALSNAAPYFKHIGVSASARLIQLFNSFSNPLFLLSDEGHPRLLFFM